MLQDIDIVSLVGGAVAAIAAGKLLLSSKYPRTWPLVCRHSSAFWRYDLYYGVLGTLVVDIIFRTDLGKIAFIAGIPRLIFWPVIGALMGTIAKFSFVGAVSDAHHFHMTARAMLGLFEPRLLEQIERDEYFTLKRIMKKLDSRWRDLDFVKASIKRNIPDRIEESERLAFIEKIQKQTAADEALILYYRFVGRRGFEFLISEPAPSQRISSHPPAAPSNEVQVRPPAIRKPPASDRQVR